MTIPTSVVALLVANCVTGIPPTRVGVIDALAFEPMEGWKLQPVAINIREAANLDGLSDRSPKIVSVLRRDGHIR